MVSMNRLNSGTRAQVIRCLVEGNSIRSTVRTTGVSKNTVAKLLVELGAACAKYQDEAMRGVSLKRIQCEEIWSFVGAKDKNVPTERRGEFGIGSVWTWTAIDAETKLVPCWMVGPRNGGTATEFMQDLAARLRHRVQLTTDGHKAYLDAVEHAFGSDIDYAMLVKLYGADNSEEKRYSPAQCIGERQNLTMRMSMRRFTRLTNGFSKKVENHVAALALYFMYYNFVRIHQTLRITPAMAAGVTERVWEVEDIVKLMETTEKRALI